MTKNYRVVASCFEPADGSSIESRRSCFCDHLSKLLEEQTPDLVVLPEVALTPDMDKQPNCGAEGLNGPTISAVSSLAARHSCNICMPIIEEDGGNKYNTAVYIDRQGKIAGRYRKHTPTCTELDLGISPGQNNQTPVILDGLRVGTAICVDENYPDLIWNWMEKGVDLLVFPSYTYAGKLMQSWAVNCGVPLVAAFPWEAVIYDRDGSIVAEGGTWTTTVRFGNHPAWIAANLNMESRIYDLENNQAKIKKLALRYGSMLDIRLMVREGRMKLTCTGKGLAIRQVEEEMELVPLLKCLSDARARADRLRKEQTDDR